MNPRYANDSRIEDYEQLKVEGWRRYDHKPFPTIEMIIYLSSIFWEIVLKIGKLLCLLLFRKQKE